MAKMVGDMLFLAQADNNLLKPELVEIDLEAEINVLFDYFSAWAEEREVQLHAFGGPVLVRGDRLMIRRALSHLLSNDLRYTPRHSSVTASLSMAYGKAIFCIANPGPGLAPEPTTHIFEWFY